MNEKHKQRINRAVATTLASSLAIPNMPLNVFEELVTDEQEVAIAADLAEQDILEESTESDEAQNEVLEEVEKESVDNDNEGTEPALSLFLRQQNMIICISSKKNEIKGLKYEGNII